MNKFNDYFQESSRMNVQKYKDNDYFVLIPVPLKVSEKAGGRYLSEDSSPNYPCDGDTRDRIRYFPG